MCLIAVKNQGIKLPDKVELKNGFDNNSDGVGIAILGKNKNQIYIKKDFKDFNDFYEWTTNHVSIDDIAIIHFRLATSGNVDIGNRHPFPITQNKMLLRKSNLFCNFAVAHNGVLADYSIKNKKFSDTQKFILDILASVKYKLDNVAVVKLIRGYIGSDKLAIIDARQRKILLIGEYLKDKGIYWSNGGYKEVYKKFDWKGSKWDCELCDSNKKVKYNAKERIFLCKKCRKGMKKYGIDKWFDNLYGNENDNENDINDRYNITNGRYEYYKNI